MSFRKPARGAEQRRPSRASASRQSDHLEEIKPWELAKAEAQDPAGDGGAGPSEDNGEGEGEEEAGAAAARLDQVLYNLAEDLRTLTLLLHPYMPTTTETLLTALAEPDRALSPFGAHPGGWQTTKVPPLFPKIEEG